MRINTLKIGILAAILLFISGCVKTKIEMPDGPKGDSGLSDYELWVKSVKEGLIDWDKTRLEISDFFIFLKGNEGKAGTDGADGADAYEIWKEYISTGDVDDPQNPGSKWSPARNTEQDFYYFLTGAKGDNGNTPYIGENGNWFIDGKDTGVPARGRNGTDGKDGKDGVDGKSAYEIWKTAVESGEIKWDGGTAVVDFFIYLSGKDGKDGMDGKDGADGKDGKDGKDGEDGKDGADGQTPYIGENGNWFIGDKNLGVPATGKGGKDGAAGSAGEVGRSAYEVWVINVGKGLKNPGNGIYDIDEYPQWPKEKTSLADFWDYLRGSSGKDGKNGEEGKSAYEAWKDYIKSEVVPNPHDSTSRWSPKDSTLQDYFYFLTAADGLSAYEIWKADVLSDDGLANPGNGVYDVTKFPLWPKEMVSLNDFYDYLRGKRGIDGKDGKDGKLVVDNELGYLDPFDEDRYNLLAARAYVELRREVLYGKIDTTYEYVNPFSGGVAYALVGPGSVLVPNATITLVDQYNKSYEWQTDSTGYVYLTRDELPEWREGDPEDGLTMTPKTLEYGGDTYNEPDLFATVTKLPYRIDFFSLIDTIYFVNSNQAWGEIRTYRQKEGKVEAWPGAPLNQYWPQHASSYPFKLMGYYRAPSDQQGLSSSQISKEMTLTVNAGFASKYSLKEIDEADYTKSLSTGPSSSVTRRILGKDDAPFPAFAISQGGDGPEPTRVRVHQSIVMDSFGKTFAADYGCYGYSYPHDKIVYEVPEIIYAGTFDDKTFVVETDGETLQRDTLYNTRYEVLSGKTQLYYQMDMDSFGRVYANELYSLTGAECGFPSVSKIFRFKKYDSLKEFLNDDPDGSRKAKIKGSVSTSGSLSGTTLTATTTYYYNNFAGIQDAESAVTKNIYDRFQVTIGRVSVSNGYSNSSYCLYFENWGVFSTTMKDGVKSTLSLSLNKSERKIQTIVKD